MKTTLKLSTLFTIAVSALFLGGCELEEIPNRDTTPPGFTFQIKGDGYDRTFDQDTDFDRFQLNLRRDQVYEITFIATDEGGVQLVQWFTGGSDYFRPAPPVSSPWIYRDGLQSVVQWQGNRGNPYSGAIFKGDFIARGGNIGSLFKFYISDFGGRNGVPNSISRDMNVYFSDRPTGTTPR